MRIVILSRNAKLYSTRRLAETAEKRGHEVFVVDHLKCNIEIEKKAPKIYYKGEYLENIDAIIPRIGASVTFYGTAVIRQFEMMKVFTAVSSIGLVRSRDKLSSLQILARAGVGLPKTVFTNYTKDVEHVIESVGGTPLVLKLLEGTQGLGVVLAETQNAATSVLEAFNGLGARVIAQEFIKEAGGSDIRCFVVGGKVIAAMQRTAPEGEFRSNLHRGGSAKLVKLSAAERATAVKAAKIMGLNVCGVDLLRSNRGPLVMEVNSSPGLRGIEEATNKNIAGMVIEFIENNAKPHKTKTKGTG